MGRGLSKASIVAAALGLLDEVGLDGLTVRAVAGRLGVQAPALYWHVRSKQDLLDEMAAEIWRRIGAELAALPPELAWRQVMIAFATVTRRMLLAYRDGAKVFSGTCFTDTGVLENAEAGIARMTAQGFTPDDIVRAYSLLYNFTIGFCIEEQAVRQAAPAGSRRETPLAAAVGPEIRANPDDRFNDLVAVLVQNTERMRASPLRSAARVAAATAAAAARQRRQAGNPPAPAR